MQFGFLAGVGEAADEMLVGTKDFGARSTFDGFDKDGVGIVVIEDDNVLVAGAGQEGKTAGQVGMNLVGVRDDAINKAEKFMSLGGAVWVRFWFWFGGANVLSYEIKVAFACCG